MRGVGEILGKRSCNVIRQVRGDVLVSLREPAQEEKHTIITSHLIACGQDANALRMQRQHAAYQSKQVKDKLRYHRT